MGQRRQRDTWAVNAIDTRMPRQAGEPFSLLGAGYFPRKVGDASLRQTFALPRCGLILVIAGSGFHQAAGAAPVRVGPGDCIVLRPGRACARGPDPWWREYWFSAAGPAVERWFERLLPDRDVLHVEDTAALVRDWRDLVTRAQDRLPGWQDEAEFAVHRLLVTVQRLTRGEDAGSDAVLTFLHRHRDAPVCDLAAWCRAQRLAYHTVRQRFQRRVGCSPLQYVQRLKLTRAAGLLASGLERPVAEIATAVGMTDPAYFSRLFRRHFGISPRQYRQQQMG